MVHQHLDKPAFAFMDASFCVAALNNGAKFIDYDVIICVATIPS